MSTSGYYRLRYRRRRSRTVSPKTCSVPFRVHVAAALDDGDRCFHERSRIFTEPEDRERPDHSATTEGSISSRNTRSATTTPRRRCASKTAARTTPYLCSEGWDELASAVSSDAALAMCC